MLENEDLLLRKGEREKMAWGKIQRKNSCNRKKNAATFDQRQVSYFDFEQQPIITESLNSLLHPVEEHDIAKRKNPKK